MAGAPPPPPERSPLYNAITGVLSCALGNDDQLQKLANERKQQLEVVDQYPMVLCEIIGSEEEAPAERQLAATFLKNYLEELYTHSRENLTFYGTGMGKRIALQLLTYLENKNQNLIHMVTYDLALLLAFGFWDTLTLQLNDMVTSDNPDTVHNGVCVLAQAIDSKFFVSQPLYRVDHHWFDVLLGVFKMKHIRSLTRASTISPMFVLMKYVRPNASYLPACWTRLSEEFEKGLNETYSASSDFQFKREILKCLAKSTDEFSHYCNIFVPPVLPAIGNLLTICCEQYKKIVRDIEKAPKDASEEQSEPTNFYHLVSSILEFIYSLMDMNYFDVLVEDLENLLYCIFVFMACHGDMDRHLYVDLVDKDHRWSIRDLCCQIITFALQKIEANRPNGKAMFFKTLHNVFQRFSGETESSSSTSDDVFQIYYMTRITESMIFGLGLVRERYSSEDPQFVFPLDYYINLWTGMLEHCIRMLQGRIIWLGGVFGMELSPTLLSVHLKAILKNLSQDDKYLLAPSADALCNYLKMFEKEAPEKKFIISTMAKDIMDCLISVLRKSTDFPLRHSLNALGCYIKTYKEIASSNIDNIEDILIKTVASNFADTLVMKEVNFVVAKLAQNHSFKILIHDKFLTFLLQIVHSSEPKQMRHDPDKALDILNTFSLYAITADDYFVLQTFMGAATLLNRNTDRDSEIDESSANLLITLLVKFSDKLKFIQQMPKSQPVIGEFPQLLESLSELKITVPGHVFGKLVIVTIFALPELMECHFETLLKNVITGTCKNYKNVRGNWIIFAFICMIRTSDTLNYLSVLPGPNGGSALNFMMKLWMIDYIPDLETIERKIFVLALTQIIQNCLKNESDYSKMKELCIAFDQKPNEESPTGEVFNGLEFLYYLLIEFLFYEDKLQKFKPPPIKPYHFADFGEDMNTRTEEGYVLLFHNHPFNIDILDHTIAFLKTASEPYFNVIKKCYSTSNYFKLKDLGCNVPEMNIQEDME